MNLTRPLLVEGRNSEFSLTRIRVFGGHGAWLIMMGSLPHAREDSTAPNARPADVGSVGEGAVLLGRVGLYPVSLRTNAGLGVTFKFGGPSTDQTLGLAQFPLILKSKASSLIRTCGEFARGV